MSSVVSWLEAELARVEELARAATPGPWVAEEHAEYGFRVGAADGSSWVAWTGEFSDEPESSRPDSLFIAANSPASVLRRVAADRQILTEHAKTAIGGCVACADTRHPDPRQWALIVWPCRTVLLLAEAWGWTEEAP